MTDIVLENVIISFPHLFEAKQYEGQGAFRYSANFIFPADYNFTNVNVLVAAARVEKGLDANHPKSPLSLVKTGPYKDHWMLAAYAYEYAPQVVDQATAPLLDRTLIWAGCRVHANVDIYGHNKAGGGVTAGLKHVMIVDNVESAALPRLDSRQDAADVFAPIQGAPAATAAPVGAAPVAAPVGVPAAAQPGQPAAAVAQPGFAPPAAAAAPVAQPGFAPPVAAPGQPQ